MDFPLTKVIAESGLVSRRGAEKLIRSGQVKINGRQAPLGAVADPQKDIISVNNRPLPKKADKIYIKLNKPKDYTCTNREFLGEKNIFNLINISERLFAVGRLDKDSCGLVILTNDGDLALRLAHPRYGHIKRYEVTVLETLVRPLGVVASLRRGVDIGSGDGIVRAATIEYLENKTFIITLNEGKKRQIRRMFEALNLTVTSLRRVSFAGLELGGLKEGQWVRLSEKELNRIKS